MLERAPFWIVIKIIDSFPSMLQWHCLYILVSMKVRKWQIIKRLKICLNEECLHHWTNYLEQISKFIFFWLCVLIISHTHFRIDLHSAVAWMSLGTPCSKQARYLKMQLVSPAVISFFLPQQWCFRTIKMILVLLTFMVNWQGIRIKRIRFKFILQLTLDNSNSHGTFKKVRPIESLSFRKVW